MAATGWGRWDKFQGREGHVVRGAPPPAAARRKGNCAVRIGTWNLDRRWEEEHRDFLLKADCDVWLLTEVNERVAVDGYTHHWTSDAMQPKVRWAGVYSRIRLEVLPDPHVATAAAEVNGVTYWSSILPWKGSSGETRLPGSGHAEQIEKVLAALLDDRPRTALVWGGDWNHALCGMEEGGSMGGRQHVLAAVDELRLQVPTAVLSHWIDGHLSIDHVAVPKAWQVLSATRLVAKGLSDHDCYVVEVADR